MYLKYIYSILVLSLITSTTFTQTISLVSPVLAGFYPDPSVVRAGENHNGLFYVTCTLIDHQGNFVVTAKDPAGPWSDPVWLPLVKTSLGTSSVNKADFKWLEYFGHDQVYQWSVK